MGTKTYGTFSIKSASLKKHFLKNFKASSKYTVFEQRDFKTKTNCEKK